ncbi:DNA polymerase IV [Weissella sagaensis]|uniref:DNA polymerase IV n=1 Tax=Weissella sagaensis TaxID=2559928 RepID=A0ABW1RQX4_9LACO
MMTDFLKMPIHLNTDRRILHIDMDAFYAQIEMRDNPAYRNVPLILAHDPRKTGGRGVVATANYSARELGVHSAMSAAEAVKLAPHAVFVTPDFQKYRDVSRQLHQIFKRYTQKIEPVAFDEAYLDITQVSSNHQKAVALAHELQQVIYDELNLTSSVGMSFNKFLAKLASEHNKPSGITIINEEDIRPFLDKLSIQDIRGVGKKTAEQMMKLGINTGADLFATSQSELANTFGKSGYAFYEHIRGVDNRPVMWQRERKSLGKERTYGPFLDTEQAVLDELKGLAQQLAETLIKAHLHGKTLVLKLRDSDFNTETRRETIIDFLPNDEREIYRIAQDIFEGMGGYQKPIRLLGLTMTNLAALSFENVVLNLYE